MSKYVLVIGGGSSYYQPFRKFGIYCQDENLFEDPARINLVLFTGGADISPDLYDEPACSLTYTHRQRDVDELIAFRTALRLELPIAGVCRGAQFLCAMAGGKLVQHVESHSGHHMSRLWDGRDIYLSSTHHQMMLPPPDATLLAWAEPRRSRVYLGGNDVKLTPPEHEAEIVHFPSIRAVGMQYHPEMMSEHSEGFRLAEELVADLLIRKK